MMKKIRKTILATMLMALCLCGCDQLFTSSIPENVSWATFSSQKHGIAIDYPESWHAKEYENGIHNDDEAIAIIFPRNQILPGIIIALQEMNSSTLTDVANWGEERVVSRYTEYELNEIQSIVLSDDQEALTRTYITDVSSPLPIMHKDVYIIRKDEAIILSFTAAESNFEELSTSFEHMLSTLQID